MAMTVLPCGGQVQKGDGLAFGADLGQPITPPLVFAKLEHRAALLGRKSSNSSRRGCSRGTGQAVL